MMGGAITAQKGCYFTTISLWWKRQQIRSWRFHFFGKGPCHGQRSYAVTDLAQLPDGRVLLLMRKVAVGFPPFDTLIAIGEPPASGAGAPWSPAIAVRLEGHVPRENYEGMTVRAAPDGRIAVWIIADDNFSVIQRSLLVKLRFDPASTGR